MKDQVRLNLDLAKTDLVLDTAVPFGLIVNELISNSLKHAFPDGKRGEIKVHLRKLTDNRLSLAVSDDGVGFPEDFSLEHSGSMGTRLIRILSEQLGGEVRYSGRGGTTFTMIFSEYREAGTVVYGSRGPVH